MKWNPLLLLCNDFSNIVLRFLSCGHIIFFSCKRVRFSVEKKCLSSFLYTTLKMLKVTIMHVAHCLTKQIVMYLKNWLISLRIYHLYRKQIFNICSISFVSFLSFFFSHCTLYFSSHHLFITFFLFSVWVFLILLVHLFVEPKVIKKPSKTLLPWTSLVAVSNNRRKLPLFQKFTLNSMLLLLN